MSNDKERCLESQINVSEWSEDNWQDELSKRVTRQIELHVDKDYRDVYLKLRHVSAALAMHKAAT